MLNAFRERLFKAKKVDEDDGEISAKKGEEEKVEQVAETKSIWTHKLEIEEEIKQKVIDANIAEHDRFDIYDPRNPLNKRKREESHHIMKDKKQSGGFGHSSSRYDKR
jgi:peptidyl-prolyl cis-trans isomerase SDCCAG10